MTTKRSNLRDKFDRAQALLLALLMVVSVITPLYVGTTSADAAEDYEVYFDPARDYYFNISKAPEDFKEAVEKSVESSDKIGVRFVDDTGKVLWVSDFTKDNSIPDPELSPGEDSAGEIAKFKENLYLLPKPTSHETGHATRMIIRDLSVTPAAKETASPKAGDTRILFKSNSVDCLEELDSVSFLKPKIQAISATTGNPVAVGNIISAAGTALKQYHVEDGAEEGQGIWWYIDIPTNSITSSDGAAIISSFVFSCDSYKLGSETVSKTVSTQPLAIVDYNGYVFYDGAIPRDPHIYKIENTALSKPADLWFAQVTYQNYFVFNDQQGIDVSKYAYPYRFSDSRRRKVWVYNENWKGKEKIYATGDLGDPLEGTQTLIEEPANSGWFVTQDIVHDYGGSYGEYTTNGLVIGARYKFHVNKNDPDLAASDIVSVPLKDTRGNLIDTSNQAGRDAAKAAGYTPYFDEDFFEQSSSGPYVESADHVSDTAYYMSSTYEDQWVKKSSTEEAADISIPEVTKDSSASRINLYSVKATYYDYLSNQERNGTWRTNVPIFANYGNDGNYANQFSDFNNDIDNLANGSTWRYPLFFGNFAEDTTMHQFNHREEWLNPYYNNAHNRGLGVNSSDLFWAVNSSQPLGDATSVIEGLVYKNLKKNYFNRSTSSSDGGAFSYQLMVDQSGSTAAPYFDSNWLRGLSEGQTAPSNDEIWIKQKTSTTNTYYLHAWTGDAWANFTITNANLQTKNGSKYWVLNKNLSTTSYGGGTKNQLKDFSMFLVMSNSSYGDQSDNYNLEWGSIYNFNGNNLQKEVSSNNRRAVVINSKFPFRQVEENGITHYKFDVEDNDVIRFADDNGSTTSSDPTKLTYYHADNQTVRNSYNGATKGFFPFDDPDTTGINGQKEDDQAKDFGFGVKMEMNFKLPKNGVYSTGGSSTPTGYEIKKISTTNDNSYGTIYKLQIPTVFKKAKLSLNGGSESSEYDLQSLVNDSQYIGRASNSWYYSDTPSQYKATSDGNNYTIYIRDETKSADIYLNTWGDGVSTGFPGWGIKSSNSFTVSASGSTQNDNHAKFTFTGDDDLWVFIDGQLVLDMGGAHSKATGSIDFGSDNGRTISATTKYAAQVNGGTKVTTSNTDSTYFGNAQTESQTFDIDTSDTTKVHTMTIYYMERGLLDSNMSIDFSTMPANTEVDISKKIDTGNINDGFLETSSTDADDAINRRDRLAFRITDNNSAANLSSDFDLNGTRYSRYDEIDDTENNPNAHVGYYFANRNAAHDENTNRNDNIMLLHDGQTARFTNTFNVGDSLTVGECGDGEDSLIGADEANGNYFNYSTYFRLYDAGGTIQKINNGITQAGDKENVGNPSTSTTGGATEVIAGAPTKKNALETDLAAKGGYYKFNSNDTVYHRSVSFPIDDKNEDPAHMVTRSLDYLNRIDTTDLVVSTEIVDSNDYSIINKNRRRFTYKLEVYDGKWSAYPFEAEIFLYDTNGDHVKTESNEDASYETKLTKDGTFSLSKYDKIIIHGLPTNLPYRITETRDTQFGALGYIVNNDIATIEESGNLDANIEKYLKKFVGQDNPGTKQLTTYSGGDAFNYTTANEVDPINSDYLCKNANGAFVLNASTDVESPEGEAKDPEEALEAANGTSTGAAKLSQMKKANSIQILNYYNPVPGSLQASKTVNNLPIPEDVNPEQFRFKAELEAVWESGFDQVSGSPYTRQSHSDIDTRYDYAVFSDAAADSNGAVNFYDATFGSDNSGDYYLYKISEIIPDSNTPEYNNYVWDESVYYAVIYINKDTGNTEVKYYNSADPENSSPDYSQVTWETGDALKWNCCGDELKTSEGKANPPTFNNNEPTQSTNVTFKKVEKRSGVITPLKDAEFTLYTDEACGTQGVKSGDSGAKSDGSNVVSSSEDFENPAKSGEDGLVTFKGLNYSPHSATSLEVDDKVTFDVYLSDIQNDAGVASINGTLQFNPEYLEFTGEENSKIGTALNGKDAQLAITNKENTTGGTVKYSITLGGNNAIKAADIPEGGRLVIASFEFKAIKASEDASAYSVLNSITPEKGQEGAVIGTVGAYSPTKEVPNITSSVDGGANYYISTYKDPTRAYTVYYLKETQAPAGFTKLDGTFRLLIDSSGNSKLEYKGKEVDASWGAPSNVIGTDGDYQTVINTYQSKPADFTVSVKKEVKLNGTGEDILDKFTENKPTFEFNAELWNLDVTNTSGAKAIINGGTAEDDNDNSLVELFTPNNEDFKTTENSNTASFTISDIDINDITVNTLVYKITEVGVDENKYKKPTALYAIVKLDKGAETPFTVTYTTDLDVEGTPTGNTIVNTLKSKTAGFEILGTKMVTNSKGEQVVPPQSFDFSAELIGANIEDIYGNSYSSEEDPPSGDDILKEFVEQFKFNDSVHNEADSSRFEFTKNGIDMTEIASATLTYKVTENPVTSELYDMDPTVYTVVVLYSSETGVFSVIEVTKENSSEDEGDSEDSINPMSQIEGEDPPGETIDVKFLNTYKSADKSFELTASKTIASDYSSGTPAENQFSFTATLTKVSYKDKESETPNVAISEDVDISNFSKHEMFGFVQDGGTRLISSTSQNKADGTITFDKVQYDTNRYTEVELTYTISEDNLDTDNPDLKGITKDETTYTVTVKFLGIGKDGADEQGFSYEVLKTTSNALNKAALSAALLSSPISLAALNPGIMPIAASTNNVVFTNTYKKVTPNLSLTALKHVTTSANPNAEEGEVPGNDLNGAFKFTATLKSVTITDLVNNKTYAYSDGSDWTINGEAEDGSNTVPADIKKLFLFNGENASNPTETGAYSQTATNTGDTVTFDMLTDNPNIGGLEVTDLTYTIEEKDIAGDSAANGKYDKDTHTWTVTVEAPAAGATEPTFTYSSETATHNGYKEGSLLDGHNAAFLNIYTANNQTFTLQALKYQKINGGTEVPWAGEANAFTFTAKLLQASVKSENSEEISYQGTDGTHPLSTFPGYEAASLGAGNNGIITKNVHNSDDNKNDLISFAPKEIDLNGVDFDYLVYEISETEDNRTTDKTGWTMDTNKIYAKVTRVKTEGNPDTLKVEYSKGTSFNPNDSKDALQHFTNTYTAKNANIAFNVAKTLDGAQVPDELVSASAFTFTATLNDHQNGGIMVFDSINKMVTPTPADFAEGSSLYTLTGTMSNENGRTNVKFAAQEGASIDANKYDGYTFVYTITEDALKTPYDSQYTKDNSTVYAVVKINSATEPYYSVEYYSEVTVTTANPSQPGTLQLVSKNKISDPPFTFKNTTLISTLTTTFQFKKVDADGTTPLEGAEFMLYSDDACTTPLPKDTYCDPSVPDRETKCTYDPNVANVSAKDTGLVTYDYISYKPGGTKTFYMRETKAADKHELSPNTFKIEIGGDGAITLSYKAPGDPDWTKIEQTKVGDEFIFQISNNPSTHLPLAGGSGVAMFYIFGLAAVLIAAGGYGIYRKRLNLRAGAWEEIPPEK